MASWAFTHRQPVGRGTDTLPSAEGLHLPLIAGERAVGVLSLHFKSSGQLATEQRDLLESFVRQIALVLDRQRLRDSEQQVKLIAESERLSKTLLNSISHEIRTPIAAIMSATSTLEQARKSASGALPWSMVDEIGEATGRLNRLVGNLLSMTRLESGHVKAKLDWCDVADLVNVTVKEIDKELAGHQIIVEIARGLPLVRMDFVLMQQALTNLVLNAAIHTSSGTEIRVGAVVAGETLVLTVADNGPGLLAESLPLLFDKFYRAPTAPAGGTGLGLAIVKGLVEAQGGEAKAENRPGGGARFTITVPLSKTPPMPSEAIR